MIRPVIVAEEPAASAAVDRVVLIVVILSIGLALLALFAIYWSMPSPHRAVAPAPLDKAGYTYTCYCFRDPVRVQIQTRSTVQPQGRHARRDQPPQRHRIRPNHVSHAGADGGGKGGSVPAFVAA